MTWNENYDRPWDADPPDDIGFWFIPIIAVFFIWVRALRAFDDIKAAADRTVCKTCADEHDHHARLEC